MRTLIGDDGYDVIVAFEWLHGSIAAVKKVPFTLALAGHLSGVRSNDVMKPRGGDVK
jgi:hypothetical protein